MNPDASSSNLIDSGSGAAGGGTTEAQAASAGATAHPGAGTGTVEIPKIDPQLLAACIHCGLCLPACPTYLATGREMESPRGRIYLMNLWASGKEPLNERMAEHIESCLGCLGCQTACPSGVPYEKILNQARPYLSKMKDRRTRKLARFVFAKILPDYNRLRKLANLIRLWQISGGDKILSAMPWLAKAFGRIAQWQSFLPPLPKFVPLPRQSWV